ncbi:MULTISPECIES: diacylglycerol kinase family protein [Micrococcaceae]|uniref:diacylglycerol/lipid kinase family protein n=1 Tax=Micrococcaceae TaxID=1268 RepID=UPI000CFBC7A6|nr:MULTISPECIES: diacylglycerol kinase family protein [unclassified Arthrobacter]MCS3493961.1 YegS/Rv2252/BmrU family lipid kinase [Arthrobacter sp. JUb119]PQZ85334.1 diacylglycerol kinase [Arthrobacter sp. MYb222]TDU26956.1 YegS/Rv2252/BmrU family lipid kinase [Arthrobacter sp. JUb115]
MQTNRVIVFSAVAAAAAAAATSWYSVRKLSNYSKPLIKQPEAAEQAAATKVALVINPSKSGADEAREAVVRVCAEAGLEAPLVLETTKDNAGQDAAREALDAQCDTIIAAGGDGTIRAVAEVLEGTGASLGILPLGTGNLLARNVDIPLDDLHTAALVAVRGMVRRIDVGHMKLQLLDGKEADHAFLVIAGVGTDADLFDDTNEELKSKVGWLAYSEAGLRQLPGQRKKVSFKLSGDESWQTRKVRSVLFANCGKLQGLDFVPDAKIDDGVLDAVILSPRSAAGWTWILLKTAFRAKNKIPVMSFYQTSGVSLRCDEPMNTQIDGDPTGQVNELQVSVNPSALRLRTP